MELFIQDKFSFKKPTWNRVTDDVSRKITLDLPSSLVTHLGTIKSIYISRATEINSKNIMIEGVHNSLIIKKFEKKNKKELDNKIVIYKKIKEKNLPGPQIINTNVGYFFDMSNNELGIALEYIKGNYFNGAKNELEKTSLSISKLMDGTRSIKLDSHNIEHIFPSNSGELIELFMKSLPIFKQFTNTERSFIKENYKKISLIEKDILERISIFDNINFELLHRDIHPHNILINKSNVVLIDTESILPTKWPIAIGFAAFKLLRQFCVRNTLDNHNVNLMHKFVHNLVRTIDIDESEYEILFLGAKIEILRRILVIMKGNLNNNISPWNSVLDIQIRALFEINYMESKLI